MTTSFETTTTSGFQGAGNSSTQELTDDSCGESVDWLRRFEGLPRLQDRCPGASGSLLTKVIERDIIPRLFLAHREPPRPAAPELSVAAEFPVLDCDLFCELILGSETAEIMDRVQSLIDRGIGLKRIYLDLLAPVARRLGEFWEADRCTFTDVTIGLARLHQILREIGRRDGENFRQSTAKRRIYLVPSPGEQHTFGLSMVEEFFLHAGWETAADHAPTSATILRSLSTRWIDVIGFSVGCTEHFGPMLDLAKQARQASANANLAVMVGGRLFADHPDFIDKVGSIAAVSDGVHAVDAAQNLLSQTDMIQQST